MQFESNFECLSLDRFSLQENFINNECDPDVNFYQNNVLNIRNMKKNFENFKEFLKNLNVSFSAICSSETWCESQDESQNSNYVLSGYKFFYQYRQYRRGGGVRLFVKESFLLQNYSRFANKL